MSVTPSSTIVGVFRDRSAAEQALSALYNAGFEHEQIQYLVPGTSGSFFEDLKNLFTGTNDNQDDLANNLTNMGLSDAEVQYYSNEYNNGNTILIVRAPDRQTEAMNVLHQYGAYSAETEPGYAGETTESTQHAGNYTQQESYAASEQYNDVQNLDPQLQTQTAEEHPFAEPQPGNIFPEDDTYYQNTQPTTPLVHEEVPQDTQANVVTPEQDNGYQAPQTDTVTNEQVTETPASQLDMAAPHVDQEYQTAQVNEVAPEHETNDQSVQSTPSIYESETTNDQASVATPGTDTIYQEYQTAQVNEVAPDQDTNDQSVQSIPSSYEAGTTYDQTTVDAPEHETIDQSEQPIPTSTYESGTTYDQASAAIPGTDTNDQVTPVDSVTPEQDASSQVVTPTVTEYDTQPQVEQAVPATPGQETEMQPLQTGAVSPEPADELQQLQAQLQTLQQQLQEAKAQLQAAKDQEDQIKSAKERERQLQSVRQQFQDLQAELQATLAELKEVQSRIAQYQ